MTEKIMKWWPVAVMAATLVAGGAVAQYQIGQLAGEQEEMSEDIEENSDDIEVIQQQLIRRQGEIGIDLERLRIEQDQQSDKLDEVLELLRNSQ